MKIEDCGLKIRTRNALVRAGINNIGDLFELTNRYGREVLYSYCWQFGKGCMNDLLTNENTKYVMNFVKNDFDKDLFLKDKENESRHRSLEHLESLIDTVIKSNDEIYKLKKSLGLTSDELVEIWHERNVVCKLKEE